MVLSRIVLNLESHAARRDLADAYQMHSTLMRLVDGGGGRPLWRLETGKGGRPPFLLVQTETTPVPELLSPDDDEYFMSFESKQNQLVRSLQEGDGVRFRLRANPTVTRAGKRHGLLREEEQREWIDRQLGRSGLKSHGVRILGAQREQFWRRRGKSPVTLLGVTFDGYCSVTDPAAVENAVRVGIGHGKSFGFGLLTLGR